MRIKSHLTAYKYAHKKKVRMKQEIISLREFSRRLEVSEKTIRDGIRLGKIKKGVTEVKGKSQIIYDIAKKECEEIGLGYRAKLRRGEDIPPPKKEKVPEPDGIAGLDGTTSLAQAQRAEKIFKAQLASLEVEEKAGILVRRDEVYRELFEFGQEIKSGLQSIPDRITDELMAISDRDAFHSLLSKSIEDELLRLSKFKEKNENRKY